MSNISLISIWRYIAARLSSSGAREALLFAIPVGVAAAITTTAFRHVINVFQLVIFGRYGDPAYLASISVWYVRLLAPTIGGVIAGSFLWMASRPVKQSAHPEYMEAITIGNGDIPIGHTLLRSISSVCSIASGASIGREGPMVQLAALSASLFGRLNMAQPDRLRTIVACGAAAGIAAAYNAPIAGALFVAEIVLGQVASQKMGQLIVSAVAANLTMRLLPGYEPMYEPGHLWLPSPPQLLLFPFIGVLLGALAPPYLKILEVSRSHVTRVALPAPVALGIGGLCVGVISLAAPATWGNGYAVVGRLIDHPAAWQAVAVLLVLKIASTAAASASGAVGGVFTPTIFVGAAFGALVACASAVIAPSLAHAHSVFVIVGMGAFLAATTQAPLMSALIVLEMTGSYKLTLPLVMAIGSSFATARAFSSAAMYSATSRINARRAAAIAARGVVVAELLKRCDHVLPIDASVADLRSLFSKIPAKYVYLVDAQMGFRGTVARRDIYARPWRESDAHRLVAEFAKFDVPTLALRDSIPSILEALRNHEGERIPVLSDDGQSRFLGVVSKSDFLKTVETMI